MPAVIPGSGRRDGVRPGVLRGPERPPGWHFPWLHGPFADGASSGGLPGAAGAFVGGVGPGHGQAGDDRRHAAADDEGVPGRELPDHVRGHDRVARIGVVLVAVVPEDGAGFFHGRAAAEGGTGVEGVGVGDAG